MIPMIKGNNSLQNGEVFQKGIRYDCIPQCKYCDSYVIGELTED